MGLLPSITPYSIHRIDNSDNYKVSWTEWDGNCMCTRITKHGVISVPDHDTEFLIVQQAIIDKYYGDN